MAVAAASALTLFVVTFAVILNTAAADPDMLQDVCVADLSSSILLSLSLCLTSLHFQLYVHHYFIHQTKLF